MQTRNHRVPTRLGGLGPWIVMLTLGILTASGSAVATPNVKLTDGDGVLDDLPVGTDLYVEANGLQPSSSVDVLLLDWNGVEILRQHRNVDGQGDLESKRLWYRTGIGGCDCKMDGRGYPFQHPYEALQMIDYEVTVRLVDTDTGVFLAQHMLTVARPSEPLIYTSGVRGCPRERFEDDRTLMIMSTDSTPPVTVFLVAHRESWKVGDPIVDVRDGYQEGQAFQASADGLSGVLWQGVESGIGKYDLLIRPGTDQGQPVGLTLRSGDRLHSFFGGSPDGDPGGRSNGGLVIDDWGCH